MFGISNRELEDLPPLKQYIDCARCGRRHLVKEAAREDGSPSVLSFYNCRGSAFLAGIDGKDVTSHLKKK